MTSRAKELADAEADRVEAEELAETEPDGDGDAPTEPDEPVEDPYAEDRPSLEATFEAFERENHRHAAALGAILGADFEAFEPCPSCDTVGFRPSVAPKEDPEVSRCERCGGHGFMLTGSLNEMSATRPCTACQGNGFTHRPVPMPAPPPAAPAVAMFDPYTGLPLAGVVPATGTAVDPQWAPGFVPGGAPVPGPNGAR